MSEVRALLLTDVVDSTKLSEALGDAAVAVLWAAHDRLARDLLPSWRGREIDKTDGMLLLFETAPDAVAYAVAYHQGLAELSPPLKARVGLHVGTVVLRENIRADVARGAKPLEVDGTAKAIAARVMSIANGGQTLLSADAHESLGKVALRSRSHGHWRMKGIADPVELFEVGGADAPFIPPPDAPKAYRVVREGDIWLPAREIRHSLPAERDAFVGRREALVDLATHLDSGVRLVTLLGIGGTGKTRLVTHFGWSWLGDFPGGVWFCDLSQARGADGIVNAVAQGLNVPLGNEDPVTQLGNAIAGRGQCLVILDNFEQVARYAEETLGRWLNRAGNAQFLVTTREVLGLKGESILAVAPLQAADAVALFMRRAAAAKPDFTLNGEDELLIGRLAVLLDCLPLAIELAAARVRVMSPRTLLARMGDRFRLLASTGTRQDRQATLQAVFDWSWDLLSPAEKAALAQLSVFEGGFTLESTEAVLDLGTDENALLPMDGLQSLLQKSFVRQVSEARFDLLMSVKEYAAEHLRTEGRYAGSGAAARRLAEVRHGEFFAGLDEKALTVDRGVELDNFVASCRRAVAREDADTAANALERAWTVLRLRGPFRIGAELASIVRDTPGLKPAAIAMVEWVAGQAFASTGKNAEACMAFEATLARARDTGDRLYECRALSALGFLDLYGGRMESSRARLVAAMGLARELSDRTLEGEAHNILGNLQYSMGQMDQAQASYEAGLLLARETGDLERAGRILANLGMLYGDLGSLDKARTNHEAALAAARELGDKRLEGNVLSNLGLLNHVLGRFADAVQQLAAALGLARYLGQFRLEGIVLCNLGMVYEGLGENDEARDHYDAALVVDRELGDERSEGQVLGYLGLLHARQSRFDQARNCLIAGEALLRRASDQLSLAILLGSRAETEHLAGTHIAARSAFAEADAIARATGAGPDSELGRLIARVRTLLDQQSPG